MPSVQIDETELLQYRQLHGAAAAILANPEARKLLHKAQRIVNPNARIPEVEAEERVQAEVGGVREELAKISQQLAADRTEREAAGRAAELNAGWDRQKADLRRRGFTDEGLAKIEAHAIEQGIPNLRAAANDYIALNPPPEPNAPSGFGGWDFFGEAPEKDEFVEKMIAAKGDDDSLLNAEIRATLSDIRGQRPAMR